MIEINLTKMKKGTGTKKTTVYKKGQMPFTQTFASGKKEPVKKTSGRKGTGKIDKLPDAIKKEILELRGSKIAGPEIKERVENLINDNLLSGKMKAGNLRSLISAGVVNKPFEQKGHGLGGATIKPLEDIPDSDLVNQPYTLQVTPQGLTEWAKKQGVTGKTRETVKHAKEESEAKWKDSWDKINAENSKLQIEIRDIRDRLKASEVNIRDNNKVREKLRTDLIICREELKS